MHIRGPNALKYQNALFIFALHQGDLSATTILSIFFFWQWRRWRLQHKQVDCTINFFEKDITMLVNALWMFRPRSVPFLFRTSGKVKLARLMNMIWKTNWSLELIDDNCLQFFLQWRWWRLQHKQVYGTINCFNGFMMLVNALWMLWKMNW